MPKFYTVDRRGTVSSNMRFELQTDYSQTNIWTVQDLYNKDDAVARLNHLYPDGLSSHGVLYLAEGGIVIFAEDTRVPLRQVHSEPIVEAIFELVRQSEFSHLPSRMQSMFGWCELQDAVDFRNQDGGAHLIYEVESSDAFIGDQNLLFLGGSVIGSYELARKYWSGERRSTNSRLEAVIPLPVAIGRSITMANN